MSSKHKLDGNLKPLASSGKATEIFYDKMDIFFEESAALTLS